MEIVFFNNGIKHQVLRKVELDVLSLKNNKKIHYKPKIGNFNILANSKRKIIIDWPKGIPPGPVKVNYTSAKIN